jgi:glycosyltransferase involved in cell wall biosynthesis
MKITIITIVFNKEKEIEQTIQSVLNQNYSDIEYIIVDGGSTDSTLSVIERYRSNISKLISEPDLGIYDALNKGIDNASGEVIGMVHAGDMLFNNNVISDLVQCFSQTGADLIYGNTVLVEPSNIERVKRVWEGGEFKPTRFLYGWMPSHSSIYIKRSVFQKYGNYRLDLDIAADYEFLLRVMYKHSVRCSYYPGLVTRFRVGGISNKNLFSFLKSNTQCYRSWKLNNLNVPFYTIPFKILRRIPDIVLRNKRLNKYTLELRRASIE